MLFNCGKTALGLHLLKKLMSLFVRLLNMVSALDLNEELVIFPKAHAYF